MSTSGLTLRPTPPMTASVADAPRTRRPLALPALLVAAAALYLWHLDVSGMANQYYSAAALAGSQSWKAFFFGSLDAGGAITVDKPPLAIWPMALMVKVFGLSSWSVLLPQAFEGVASVAMVHATVRRSTSSSGAGLVAAVAFALTPLAALMFRYDNPDAMLTLLMIAAAYATVRALEGRRAGHWMALTGALVGAAFLCKLLQAFMILPSLVLVYALFAAVPVRRRVVHLVVAAGAMLATAGWWVLTVELWPTSSRPYVGGSSSNSVLELALGYNGIGRLTGNESPSGTASGWHGTNLTGMVSTGVWTGAMWFVPASLAMSAGALWISRRSDADRRARAAIWLWSSWLLVNTAVFCSMAGIFHTYYAIVLAPAATSLLGVSGLVLWRHRERRASGQTMALASASATVVAVVLQASHPGQLTALTPLIWVLGFASMGLLLVHTVPQRAQRATVGLALVSALIAPTAYTLVTAGTPHAGSGPQAGSAARQVNPPVSPRLSARLTTDEARFTWVAAVPGARASSRYQLATGRPVIGIGGYKQTDPSPTLDQFSSWVRHRRIHYYIDEPADGPAALAVKEWVTSRFAPARVDGIAVYDLSRGHR